MLEEEDDRVTKRGKTRQWIKRRGEKGYFNNMARELMVEYTAAYREMMRINHEDFKGILKAIEPDITLRQVISSNSMITRERRNLSIPVAICVALCCNTAALECGLTSNVVFLRSMWSTWPTLKLNWVCTVLVVR